MKLLRIIFISSIIFNYTILNAQNYTSAIGIKGGSVISSSGFGGINFKHFFGSSNAVELTASASVRNFRFQALYEWQKPTGWEDGLDWYIGAGGGFGSWRSNYWNPGNNKHNISGGFFLNGTAVIGLDYTFSDIPLNLAIDSGPSVGIINSHSFGWGGGLAIRYVID